MDPGARYRRLETTDILKTRRRGCTEPTKDRSVETRELVPPLVSGRHWCGAIVLREDAAEGIHELFADQRPDLTLLRSRCRKFAQAYLIEPEEEDSLLHRDPDRAPLKRTRKMSVIACQ